MTKHPFKCKPILFRLLSGVSTNMYFQAASCRQWNCRIVENFRGMIHKALSQQRNIVKFHVMLEKLFIEVKMLCGFDISLCLSGFLSTPWRFFCLNNRDQGVACILLLKCKQYHKALPTYLIVLYTPYSSIHFEISPYIACMPHAYRSPYM